MVVGMGERYTSCTSIQLVGLDPSVVVGLTTGGVILQCDVVFVLALYSDRDTFFGEDLSTNCGRVDGIKTLNCTSLSDASGGLEDSVLYSGFSCDLRADDGKAIVEDGGIDTVEEMALQSSLYTHKNQGR